MRLIKCKACSQEISKSAKTCPQCGHKNKPGLMKRLLSGVVVFFVIVTVIGILTDDEATEGGLATVASEEDGATIAAPAEQIAFVEAIQRATADARNAANDMAKGGVRAARAEQVCQALNGSDRVHGWVGEVKKIDSNSDGKGVFSVSLGRNVTLTTWNNAFSDIGSGTLIEPGTELFNTISSMSRGDLVKFSGRFFANDVDCVNEQSMTLDGSMRSPEYTLRFEAVEPYTS